MSQALHRWAQGVVQNHAGVVRIGYFGSYARSDWGVGSDLDVVIIVKASCHPFHQRALDWDVTALPVPADVMVYTQDEWDTMARAQERFFRTVDGEVIWVYGKNSMPQE